MRGISLNIFWRSSMRTSLFTFAAFIAVRVFGEITDSYAPDHILIHFKQTAASAVESKSVAVTLKVLESRLNLPAGCILEEPMVFGLIREEDPLRAASPVPDSFLYLRLPAGLDVEHCLAMLKGNPLLEYAEPDYLGTGGRVPADPNYGSQWHHANKTKPSASIQSTKAWNITTGSTNILVAVLDTGLMASFLEFTNRVVPGYNFAYNSTNTLDDYGHGTMVASTLCANAGNGHFGAGVDWQCRLMPVKVLDSNNSGLYSWWAQGINYAVAHGAKVINLSSGGSSADTTLSSAIFNAIQKGVIFITITHNDGVGTIRFPGSYSHSITLGATDEKDLKTDFSNWGPQISLVAPGIDIYGQGSSGSLENWHGTSFSAPLAAGVCSLMASVRPDLNQTAAFNLLCLGADDEVGDALDTPGFDVRYGWGRLNAYNSLLLATTRISSVNFSNDAPVLSWTSPSNASTKQPYLVQNAPAPEGPWSDTTANGSFNYTTNLTSWSGPTIRAPGGEQFYRVVLRSLGTK